jgi:hypothetical protein
MMSPLGHSLRNGIELSIFCPSALAKKQFSFISSDWQIKSCATMEGAQSDDNWWRSVLQTSSG